MIGVAALLGSAGSTVRAQTPIPQVRHSTYDFTDSVPNKDLVETWVDCKTPGNGWTYSVGTIEIQSADASSTFSNIEALPASGCPILANLAPGVLKKRVVMLQAVGPDPATGEDQSIRWQRIYYGDDPTASSARATNARAISVWPVMTLNGALDEQNTRIAICGETSEDKLPLQVPTLPGSTSPKGFVAVFNGAGEHLWSYQFFGATALSPTVTIVPGNAAVTDVSIRIEGGHDVVTYCGVSQVGDPPLGTLAAVRPFVAPAGCATATGGVGVPLSQPTVSGPYDGFVGRLRHVHAITVPPLTAPPEFHSIVGGAGYDGLFAIDEIDADRFVVAGFADGRAVGLTFPFTSTCVDQPFGAASLGVVMAFDASQVASGGVLQLDWSQHLGDPTVASPAFGQTIARDVLVKRNQDGLGNHLILAVGSTDDPDVFARVIPLPGGGYGPPNLADVHHGGRDGFLAVMRDRPTVAGVDLDFESGTFHGTAGDEDFRGVSGWNEFPNGCTVVGSAGSFPAMDVEVVDYLLRFGFYPEVRHEVRLDDALSSPTFGYQPARNGGLLVDEQGGGITVDEKGCVTVVGGMTDPMPPATAIYPETTGTTGTYTPNMKDGRAWNNPLEAYRVVLDLLPPSTGRTDGTGATVPGGGPQFPLAGYFGGTTPECGLVPYGIRIGGATPSVRRMHIDAFAVDSSGQRVDPAPNTTLSVVVDQPPAGSLDLAAWQLGFPGTGLGVLPPLPLGGTWIWTPDSPVLQYVPQLPFVEAQWLLPPGGGTFTVQLVSVLSSGTIPCTGEPYVASPALWVTY